MTIVDKDGKPLDGGATYRLNVPANAPVKLYWSATVYDRATHALIREPCRVPAAPPTRRACRRTPTVRSMSGSAPRRRPARKSNWVPTDRRRQVRGALPPLRPGEAVLRQDLGAAGHRARQRPIAGQQANVGQRRASARCGSEEVATLGVTTTSETPTPGVATPAVRARVSCRPPSGRRTHRLRPSKSQPLHRHGRARSGCISASSSSCC